mmetsp:Transcript_23247/g.28829  ORF Transcript_23247/g.28829 Transcript_23247/m.28829 type:complete len:171 (-) Transcript_23247:648-1160(-)|eukprot:CAMPEP_0170463382 /NCGR_PEP_ID=MMETSP0123-20130129/8515_1 /TAXON_ID=182087 /ORGANISM="Favella ehrenbergii, Strain Fehren 1" /LENGTH=170 /DNA_ID=CAMNT_0010728801 /DNA_START=214 /DNA_END=726 /DNA_ORIENTATION=-
MDYTLIKTKSGKTFAQSCFDWDILYDRVPSKLRRLAADGFRIVVFTNQGGVSIGKRTVGDLRTQFSAIQKKLGVPMTFLAATGGSADPHRKPSPVMWQLFSKKLNGGTPINTDLSFYCGDAAGRPATDTRKKDHSADDLLFARNSGLSFLTPEALFLGERLEIPQSTAPA